MENSNNHNWCGEQLCCGSISVHNPNLKVDDLIYGLRYILEGKSAKIKELENTIEVYKAENSKYKQIDTELKKLALICDCYMCKYQLQFVPDEDSTASISYQKIGDILAFLDEEVKRLKQAENTSLHEDNLKRLQTAFEVEGFNYSEADTVDFIISYREIMEREHKELLEELEKVRKECQTKEGVSDEAIMDKVPDYARAEYNEDAIICRNKMKIEDIDDSSHFREGLKTILSSIFKYFDPELITALEKAATDIRR